MSLNPSLLFSSKPLSRLSLKVLPFSLVANSRLVETLPAQGLHSVLSVHGGREG